MSEETERVGVERFVVLIVEGIFVEIFSETAVTESKVMELNREKGVVVDSIILCGVLVLASVVRFKRVVCASTVVLLTTVFVAVVGSGRQFKI